MSSTVVINHADNNAKGKSLAVQCRSDEHASLDEGLDDQSKRIKWEKRIEILRSYYDQNGNALVPSNEKDPGTGFCLGVWVELLRKRQGNLTADQTEQLNQFGFAWSTNNTRRRSRKKTEPTAAPPTANIHRDSRMDRQILFTPQTFPSQSPPLVSVDMDMDEETTGSTGPPRAAAAAAAAADEDKPYSSLFFCDDPVQYFRQHKENIHHRDKIQDTPIPDSSRGGTATGDQDTTKHSNDGSSIISKPKQTLPPNPGAPIDGIIRPSTKSDAKEDSQLLVLAPKADGNQPDKSSTQTRRKRRKARRSKRVDDCDDRSKSLSPTRHEIGDLENATTKERVYTMPKLSDLIELSSSLAAIVDPNEDDTTAANIIMSFTDRPVPFDNLDMHGAASLVLLSVDETSLVSLDMDLVQDAERPSLLPKEFWGKQHTAAGLLPQLEPPSMTDRKRKHDKNGLDVAPGNKRKRGLPSQEQKNGSSLDEGTPNTTNKTEPYQVTSDDDDGAGPFPHRSVPGEKRSLEDLKTELEIKHSESNEKWARTKFDVISGKGEKAKQQNKHYLEMIRHYAPIFRGLNNSGKIDEVLEAKRRIAYTIALTIVNKGGRFLDKDEKLLPAKRVFKRVMTSLKDWRQPKTNSDLPAANQPAPVSSVMARTSSPKVPVETDACKEVEPNKNNEPNGTATVTVTPEHEEPSGHQIEARATPPARRSVSNEKEETVNAPDNATLKKTPRFGKGRGSEETVTHGLGEWDVPVGRADVREFIGNCRFRNLISKHKASYQHAAKRADKRVISTGIYNIITSKGGRFLEQKKTRSRAACEWNELPRSDAIEKIGLAFEVGGR